MNRIILSMKTTNTIFKTICVIFCLSTTHAYGLQSPFKDAQLSISNDDLQNQKYEYSLKFKLFGVEEYRKWSKVRDIDLRFKSINSQFINSENDLNNIRNFVQALDIKQQQTQFKDYNKWMSKFRDTLTATYENSNTDVNTVLKIIAQDEEKQIMNIELNDKKNELIPLLGQLRLTWDQIPSEIVLNIKNIHNLIDSINPDSITTQSAKAYDLYSKLALAEYEFKREEDTAIFDGFEITYEKDYDKNNDKGAYGLKAVFNLNFLREFKTLYYSDRYNLQRKLLSEKASTQTRFNEIKNIKETLKNDIELVQQIEKSSFKEDKFISSKKNMYNIIDLQLVQSMQKNKFEKSSKLSSLKATILDKIVTLIYETERPLTITELRKYVR